MLFSRSQEIIFYLLTYLLNYFTFHRYKWHSFNNFRVIFPPPALLFLKSLIINVTSSKVTNLNEKFSMWRRFCLCYYTRMGFTLQDNPIYSVKNRQKNCWITGYMWSFKKENIFHYWFKEIMAIIAIISFFRRISLFYFYPRKV